MWVLFVVAVIAAALYVAGNYELTDRLAGLFLMVQPRLPVTFNAEQFLVLLTILSLLVAVLAVGGCAALLAIVGSRISIIQQKALGQAAASRREIGHVKDEHQDQLEQLVSLGHSLTKQLEKQTLIQTLVEAAGRITSVAQANSVVSFWQLRFETGTIRFERGLYCEEALFSQTEFQPIDAPFSQVVSTQQSLVLPSWEQSTLIKREKAARLGSATGLMLIPLVIERSVLGVLVIFCHPDILKSYETQKLFYEAMWGELALTLAIAIQGEMAILDRLTGLLNREYFMKRLVQEIDRANRYRVPLSLLMIDIDNFKLVNDMLGHPQGDAVLKIIAKLVKKEVRAIDLVGRYGGEEFIVLLPETGYGDEGSVALGARVVAERIRQAVDDEFRGLQKPLNLTVSIGAAGRRFPEDRASDYQDLVRLADEQLYRAKAAGKNKVCILSPEKPQQVT